MSLKFEVSPWLSQIAAAKRPSFPKHRGERDADVVIVGAGLTGCATAYSAAAAGFAPVVLEADRLGAGATAFGTGLLLPEPGPSFREVVAAHGLRAGKRVFGGWRRASLDGAALLRRLNVRCGLDPLDSLTTAHPDAERALRREYDARVEAGVDVSWLTERHVRAATKADDACGMRQSGAFGLDPYRAAIGLASAAKARGASFHEGSSVTKIKVGRKHVDVTTRDGVIHASTVIITTGRPTSLFGPLRRHFTVQDSYAVLTEEMPAVIRKQVGLPTLTLRDSREPSHRIRWTADHRALVTGARQPEAPARKRDPLLRHWTFELMYEFLRMYPAIAGLQPAYGWRLSSAVTRDGLPYIGPHRNYPRHLFALGDTDSMTGAFLAARILTRALEEAPEAPDEAFGFSR